MESPKPVGTFKGQEILPAKLVDLEKGDAIKDVETQPEEAAIENLAMANLITGVTSIVMVILIAVYIILVFVTFKNVRVGLASACSIIIAPFYIFGLVVLKDQRDIFIERFALSPRKNANGCNPSSANM